MTLRSNRRAAASFAPVSSRRELSATGSGARCVSLVLGLVLVLVSTFTAWAFAGSAFAQQQPPPFAPPVLQPPSAGAAPATGDAPTATATATQGEFGSPKQLAVSVTVGGGFQVSILRASSSAAGVSSTTSVLIQPSLDYFISPNFSVGGLISYAHGTAASIGDNTFGFQARAGYNLKINDQFSFWPRLGLGYFRGSSSGYDVPLQIFAPVLWHVVPNLFLGFGPTLQTDLKAGGDLPGADAKLTFVGVQSVVGGTFSL